MPLKDMIRRIATKYRIKWNAHEYLSSDFDKEILFVMTPGRSGSTLLRRYLMENYFVHIPPESSDIIPVCSELFASRYGKRNDQTLVRHILSCLSPSEFQHWNLSDDELLNFLSTRFNTGDNLKLDELIYGFYDLHRRKYNPEAVLVGDKTPYLVYYLDIIPIIFKRAKFIFLIRHPFAVVASRMVQFSESVDSALNRWLSAVRSIEKSVPFRSNAGVVLKYEDMIEAPQQTLHVLGDKLGLRARPTKSQFGEGVMGDIVLAHHVRSRSDIIGDRNKVLSSQLSESELKVIAKSTSKYLKLFNYQDHRC